MTAITKNIDYIFNNMGTCLGSGDLLNTKNNFFANFGFHVCAIKIGGDTVLIRKSA
ncbi:MAG: hypothetical protein JWP81_3086 [Ferruginibacter sp.]|nr:hypothetical protein [Ferruginibacter sp.]